MTDATYAQWQVQLLKREGYHLGVLFSRLSGISEKEVGVCQLPTVSGGVLEPC